MPGVLFIVSTPIGNLEDVTLRALRVLREVDLIACEDTRQTAKLLSHYQMNKPTTSYHEHNEVERAGFLLKHLEAGKKIALVCDSGTPCISDPGYRVVRAALKRGIQVVPIPGPCSFVAALSASGRATDSFTFLGFLPARQNARRTLLQSAKQEFHTLIFFEAPNRLLASLKNLHEIMGDRPLTVTREMTKIYEEIFFGSAAEAIEHFSRKPVKGEIILIVEKAAPQVASLTEMDKIELHKKLQEIVVAKNVSRNEAIKLLARQMNASRRELYQLLIEEK